MYVFYARGIIRSSHPEGLNKNFVLKYFIILTGKRLWWNFLLVKLQASIHKFHTMKQSHWELKKYWYLGRPTIGCYYLVTWNWLPSDLHSSKLFSLLINALRARSLVKYAEVSGLRLALCVRRDLFSNRPADT